MAKSKLKFQAVVRCLPSDGEAYFAWRRCDEQGRWLDAPERGDIDRLHEALSETAPEIALVVPGTEVVCQRVNYNEAERRHLARMVPFQLEDHLTTEIDDLHFALGKPARGEVTAAHINREWLSRQITQLEAAGVEINQCLIEPLLLPRTPQGWTLRLDDLLHVHYGENLGFAIEPMLATAALSALLDNETTPEHLLLMAADQDQIDVLFKLLPPSLREQLVPEQIDAQFADDWDSLALDQYDALDLRQGTLARRLPLRKWWQDWRNVSVLGLVALLVYVGVNVGYIQVMKARQTDVQQEILAAYRQVMPEGAVANPEQQLRTQVAKYEGGGEGSAVLPMLAKLGPVVAKAQDISLRSMNYNNQRQEMRVNLQGKTYDSIRNLSQSLEQAGLRVELRNSNQQGDLFQATMVIGGGS